MQKQEIKINGAGQIVLVTITERVISKEEAYQVISGMSLIRKPICRHKSGEVFTVIDDNDHLLCTECKTKIKLEDLVSISKSSIQDMSKFDNTKIKNIVNTILLYYIDIKHHDIIFLESIYNKDNLNVDDVQFLVTICKIANSNFLSHNKQIENKEIV